MQTKKISVRDPRTPYWKDEQSREWIGRISFPTWHTTYQVAASGSGISMLLLSGKSKMNEFGGNIVFEIQWNHIEQIKVHWIIGKFQTKYFIDTASLKIQLGNVKMMGQAISALVRPLIRRVS